MNFDRLTRFLDSLVQRGMPAVDLMICKDGESVYRHFTGTRDPQTGIALDGSELYQTYSLSKPVTAVAAMTLVEQGNLCLDDPVYAYLPEYRELTVGQAPADSIMTVKHLLTMTSGIRYDLALPAIKNAVAQTQGKAPTLAVAKAIAAAPLAFSPGSRFCYSLSHDVLAAVIEVVSGIPFGMYVAKSVFAPCGMGDSTFHIRPADAHRFVKQYRFDASSGNSVPMGQTNEFVFGPEYDSGGAGLCSSTEDLMRFARMLSRKGIADSGQRILHSETVDRMRINQLNDVQLADFSALGLSGYGYGLGVRTMMDPTVGSVGEFGWFGAAGGYLLADPDKGIALSCNMQVRSAPLKHLHPQLRDLCYECLSL